MHHGPGRRILALPSYRLPFVAETLGVPFGDHHDALADARYVAGLLNTMADRASATSIHELATAHQVIVGHMEAGAYRSSVSRSGTTALVQPDSNPDADPDGPLFGKVVVFTGSLTSMRPSGRVGDDRTRRRDPGEVDHQANDVMVVGNLNPARLRPGEHLSGKARRAFKLQDAGQQIEVMTEMDFIHALQGGREDPWQLIAGDAGLPGSVAPVLGPRRRPFTNLPRYPMRTTGTGSTASFATPTDGRRAANRATTAALPYRPTRRGSIETGTSAAPGATRTSNVDASERWQSTGTDPLSARRRRT